MKLKNDKIVIERRTEIDIFQDMIAMYLEKGKVRDGDRAELEAIRNQLEALYISW